MNYFEDKEFMEWIERSTISSSNTKYYTMNNKKEHIKSLSASKLVLSTAQGLNDVGSVVVLSTHRDNHLADGNT